MMSPEDIHAAVEQLQRSAGDRLPTAGSRERRERAQLRPTGTTTSSSMALLTPIARSAACWPQRPGRDRTTRYGRSTTSTAHETTFSPRAIGYISSTRSGRAADHPRSRSVLWVPHYLHAAHRLRRGATRQAPRQIVGRLRGLLGFLVAGGVDGPSVSTVAPERSDRRLAGNHRCRRHRNGSRLLTGQRTPRTGPDV